MSEQVAYETTTTTEFRSVRFGAGPAGLKLNLAYCKSLPGVIKIIELVLDFLCLICVMAGGPSNFSGHSYGTFVCLVGFLLTFVLLVLYVLHIVETVRQVPWNVVEMIYAFVWTLLFFVASCILLVAAASHPARVGGWFAAAFFGFAAMLLYGFDCYIHFQSWRLEEPAAVQGLPQV